MDGTPPQLEYRQLADGDVWVLPPRRPPTAFRVVAVVCAVVPLVMVATFALGIGPLGGRVLGGFGPQAARAGTIGLTALIAAVGLVIDWKIARFVLSAAFGRTEVELRGGRLSVRERLGAFRVLDWARHKPAERVAFLEVTAGEARVGQPDEWVRSMGGLTARLDTREGEKWPVAVGVPAVVLRELAGALSMALGVEHDPFAPSTLAAQRAAAGQPDHDETPVGVPQPKHSEAEVVRTNGEVSIRLPAMGLVRGSKGIFTFAVVWLGFRSAFIVVGVLVFGLGSGGFPASGSAAAPSLVGAGITALVIAGFIAIGVWMLIHAVSMGRRRAIIDIVGDAVLVTRKSPFGEKIEQWTADEVADVRVGPTGTEINNIPVLELQILTVTPGGSRAKVGLLSERPNDELRWIASEIRAAMGLYTRENPEPGTPGS